MARPRPLWLDLGEVSRRLAESPALLVASDFDGTLAPIARTPEAVHLAPRAREAVRRLAEAPGAHVAVLSGRRLAALDEQLGVAGIFLAGSGGLETRAPGGPVEVHLAGGHPVAGELRDALDAWCRRHTGAWVEDKGLALAVHYREMQPRLRAAFSAGVRRRVAPVRDRVAVIPGRCVFEVRPSDGWGKREALELWRAPIGAGALFFFGDDGVDEPVHRHVRAGGGIAVAVGRRLSRARYGLSGPDEVAWFLEWLEREWRSLRA